MEPLKTIEKAFADNLKRLRGERNQEDVARACEIPYRTYQDMESGTIPVKKRNEYLKALVEYFDVLETELFQDPDLPHPAIEKLAAAKLRLEILEKVIKADSDHLQDIADAIKAELETEEESISEINTLLDKHDPKPPPKRS